MRIRWPSLVLAVLAGFLIRPVVPTARACGGFFRAAQVPPEKRPSLSREKVLLIHDLEKGRQHFVREVAFSKATEPFGFVVPTPTRPEVQPVEETPFTKLREMFRHEAFGLGGLGLAGRGGGGAPPKGVQVLEEKKVGSFTAFVLAATDEKALANWLADNGLVSTAEADAWLAHYVSMKFFYVAMRYDPPAKLTKKAAKRAVVEAETIRISFDTPIPYYPYLEPEGPPAGGTGSRLLELWYVGTELVTPIGLRETGKKRSWVRPLRPGTRWKATPHTRELLEGVLEDELEQLLPAGDLVVQTFEDEKRSREGFNDILFGPYQYRRLTPARMAALRPYLAILDPELAKGAP